MFKFLERVGCVRKDLSTSAFARILGMNQKTVDLYLKGERKPSVELITNICSKFKVDANWLLGLTDELAGGANPQVTDCKTCRYKKAVEAFASALDAAESS